MTETIEEFLARGGQIKRVGRGVSGLDGQKPKRCIVINGRKMDPSDPKWAGKQANQRMFK